MRSYRSTTQRRVDAATEMLARSSNVNTLSSKGIVSTLDQPIVVPNIQASTPVQVINLCRIMILIAGRTVKADTEEHSRDKWLRYLLVYTRALFPDPVGKVFEAVWAPVTEEQNAILTSDPTEVSTADDEASINRDLDRWITDVRSALSAIELPSPFFTRDDVSHAIDVSRPEELMGHYSLVVFLCGRTITPENLPALHVNRPKAIEGKFFNGAIRPALRGELKMTELFMKAIASVWSYYGAMRTQLIFYFARAASSLSGSSVDVFYMTFKLMQEANNHTYVIVAPFVQSYPYVFKMTSLSAELNAYLSGLEELMHVEALLRPYYKLAKQDKTTIFKRGSMDGLLGLAIAVQSKQQPTLARFKHHVNPTIVAEFYQIAVAEGDMMPDETDEGLEAEETEDALE